MPRAGEYTDWIEIQQNSPTLDTSRRKVDNWKLFARRKARRPRPFRNAQVVTNDANRANIGSLTLFVRCDSLTWQIDSNFQLIHCKKVYKIEAALENGDGEIELTCKVREFAK